MVDLGDVPSTAVTLRGHGLTPRKRLGQNFLQDRGLLERIVAAGDVQSSDQVLELGAGTGSLTAVLAERARSVTAVELDDQLVHILRGRFGSCPSVQVWHGNALSFEPGEHIQGTYKLLGNIPYYVTGPIIRRYLDISPKASVLVLLVQREVAERMAAQPGSLSIFGVSVQAYARPEVVFRVPAGAFYPRPKVDSAVVRLFPYDRSLCSDLEEEFFQVVKAGFGTRRKQLVNGLGRGLGVDRSVAAQLLTTADIDGTRRPETMAIAEWVRLAAAWQSVQSRSGA